MHLGGGVMVFDFMIHVFRDQLPSLQVSQKPFDINTMAFLSMMEHDICLRKEIESSSKNGELCSTNPLLLSFRSLANQLADRYNSSAKQIYRKSNMSVTQIVYSAGLHNLQQRLTSPVYDDIREQLITKPWIKCPPIAIQWTNGLIHGWGFTLLEALEEPPWWYKVEEGGIGEIMRAIPPITTSATGRSLIHPSSSSPTISSKVGTFWNHDF